MSLGLPHSKIRRTTDAVVDLGATTDDLFNIAGPLKVWRIGVHLVDEAKTTGTAWVIQVQSVTGTTETSLGTATGPNTLAVGGCTYKDFDVPLVVAEGSYLKVEVTTAGNTGQGLVWIEYEDLPMTKAYLDTLTEMA